MKSRGRSKTNLSRILAFLIAFCMMVTSMLTTVAALEEQVSDVNEVKEVGSGLKVGASVKDITPTNDMLPIHSGNARMGLRLVGVIEGLDVRVIAIQNDNDPISLIISVETGKGPYPPDFIKWLSEATGVAQENIFWSATHVHSAPEITDSNWKTMQDAFNTTTGKNEGRYENLRKWGYLIRDQLIAAAKEAISNMVEAEVGIGYTNSYINVNRTTKYIDDITGAVSYAEGFNGDGPSDKTLSTIVFQTRDLKKPIAFIINYAMHLTSLYGNQYFLPKYAAVNGFTEEQIKRDNTLLSDTDMPSNSVGIHPDIGGMVSRYMEDSYDGAVALWMSGAAGNQNPIFRNNMIFASPATGLKTETNIPGACIAAVEYYAGIQFVDVKRAISSITDFAFDTPVTHAWGGTQLPNKTEGGNPINMHLNVMRIGDITMAGSPSELYNGIGVAMKDGALSKNTLIVNHSWSHAVETTGYFPDDLTLQTGSDKTANYMTGSINNGMTNLMNELYLTAEPQWKYATDGTAVNANTYEIVIVGLDGIAGTDDDNQLVNPAGKVLAANINVSFDAQEVPYVSLGNGFDLYGGEDGKIGTGDDIVVNFGSYAQNDASGALKDPINWRLLDIKEDFSTAVLIASQCLDAAYFNLEVNKASNAWDTSNLRSWLNSRGGKAVRNTFSNEADPGFYDTAFTTAEKAKIALTNVKMNYSEDAKWSSDVFVRPEGYATYNNTAGTYPAYDTVWFAEINSSNPNDWTGNGNNPSNKNSPWILSTTTGVSTQDYVYAISGEEYFEYFGKAWVVGDGWDLVNYRDGYFRASAYASARGAKTSPTVGLPFPIVDNLARSPGRSDLLANGVAYGVFWSGTGSMNIGRPVYGSPTEANIANTSTYGIIPMINVHLTEDTLKEGVTVKSDTNSPTGYTATFVYKNDTAQNVRFFGDCMWFAKEDYEPASSHSNGYFGEMFTPYEWEKGMYPMHVQANNNNRYNNTKYYTEMKKDGDTWTVTIPLPSGAYKYCYYVDSTLTTNAGGVTYINTNTGTKVLDPANMPLQNNISSNYANFSTVYMPFDPVKQDEDRSIELPINDPAKKGTVVFERITGVTTPGSNANVDIGIYLPVGYDDSGATEYKVFYLSHGGGGHERDWTHDGVMPNIMDHMIDEGRVDPKTIVVAVNFGTTGTGANSATVMGPVQRDYVIPLLESKYHASKKVEDRAYAGLSRGGRITAEMMVDAANDSSFIQYGTWGIWAPQDVPTDNAEFPVGAQDKPIDVIRNLSAGAVKELNKLNIIVDSGAQDKRHVITSVALIKALQDMNVGVIRGLYPNGGHDWMCWPKNLEFFVDQLWEESLAEGATVKADADSPTGYTATFVYKGDPGSTVYLASDVFHFVKSGATGTSERYGPREWENGMSPVDAGSRYRIEMDEVSAGLFSISLPLPSGAFTYCYMVDGVTKLDPANLPLQNKRGEYANFSVVYMPYDAKKQSLSTNRSVELPRENVEERGNVVFDIYTYTDESVHDLGIYLPPNYDENCSEKYNLLFMNHGSTGHERDWLNDGAIPQIMDNLIYEGKVAPTVVVTMANEYLDENQASRFDYNFTKLHQKVILNFLNENYNVYTDDPAHMAYAGLSGGSGVTADFLADDPTAYGYYGLFSGNSLGTKLNNTVIENLAGFDKANITSAIGLQDTAARLNTNRDFAARMKERNVTHYYMEADGAHDWMFWPRAFAFFAENALWQTEIIDTITSPISKIVAGCTANIPVRVLFGGNPSSASINLYNPDGILLKSININASGNYMFSISDVEAVSGTYRIKVMSEEKEIASTIINCVAQPEDLWTPVLVIGNDDTILTFGSDITFNTAKKDIRIGNAVIDNSKVTAYGKTVTISDATVLRGQQIVIAGVSYADLFPSYCFTFTINYTE